MRKIIINKPFATTEEHTKPKENPPRPEKIVKITQKENKKNANSKPTGE